MDWSGIATAPIFERGTYFAANGDFRLRVKACKEKESRNSGLLFLVEFEVLDSSRPENPIGSSGTWIQSTKSKDVLFSAVKSFVVAALGLDPNRDKAEIARDLEPKLPVIMHSVAGEENALADHTVALRTVLVKTKAGTDFTRHDFSAWTPEEGWLPSLQYAAPAHAPVAASAPAPVAEPSSSGASLLASLRR